MNKRSYQRIQVENFVAKLSDGVESCSGIVSDVSSNGLLLSNIPKGFKSHGENLSIIVSGNGEDFKMLVVPKWIMGDDSERKMGLAILEPPLGWSMFVMNFEPKIDDIWAATTHLPDC